MLATICAAAVVATGLAGVTATPASAANLTPLPVGPRPNATRVDFQAGPRIAASVDVGTGNLLVTTTELTLPGIQQDIQLGLDFNSLLLGTGSPLPAGAAGKGFAMRLGQDTKLIANTDATVLYLAPGGLQGLYRPVTGTSNYTSPVGFKNHLVKNGTSGWLLTDHATRAVSTFNTAGTLTKITDRNGQATTLAYSGTQLTSITSTRGGPNARKATMTFSGGLLTGMTQASDTTGSRSVSYGYDTANQRLTSITDTAGGVSTLTWNATTGDLASIKDPSTTVLSFSYDTAHRVASVSKGSATGTQAITRFAYPSTTQSLVAGPNTDQSQPVTAVPRTTYTLDGTDRVTQAVDELGRTRSATYTTAHADVASITTGGGGVIANTWDANSGESLTKVISPTGATASLSYTDGTNAWAPSGAVDPQGNASVIDYDGAGNPASTTNSATTDKASVTFRTDGTLATSTDPKGNVLTYDADPATKQITVITQADPGLNQTWFEWDGYARLKSVSTGGGVTATYTYTNLDQVDTIDYPDSTPSISYTYTDSGQVRTRTDGNGTVTYTYNDRDELTSRTATTGGGTLGYDYDLAGNLTSATTARGTTTYEYDDANQLVAMKPPGAATTRFAYNADGLRTDTWWKSNAAHTSFAAHTHTDYDKDGRIKQTWTSRNSSDTTKVFDTTYCYVAVAAGQPCPTSTPTSSPSKGLIQWSHDNLTNRRTTYTYDSANRLKKAAVPSPGTTYEYDYDKNGNRTTVKVNGVTTQSLSFIANGNRIGSTDHAWSGGGNLIQAPGVGQLSYNSAGQMTAQDSASTDTSYKYAGPGQNELITHTVTGGDTTKYVYSRNSKHDVPVIDSFTINGAAHYLDNDPDGTPLAMELPTGKNGYFVLDGTGSVVALIDGQGDLEATYTYDPYGTITAATGTGALADANPYRHHTGLVDASTGFVKHGTRWNDTTTGRWTTTDPITRLNDPNQANPYQYAADNPINYIDPTGGDVIDIVLRDIGIIAGAGTIGALVGAAIGCAATWYVGCTGATIGGAIGGGLGLIFGYGFVIGYHISQAIYG